MPASMTIQEQVPVSWLCHLSTQPEARLQRIRLIAAAHQCCILTEQCEVPQPRQSSTGHILLLLDQSASTTGGVRRLLSLE